VITAEDFLEMSSSTSSLRHPSAIAKAGTTCNAGIFIGRVPLRLVVGNGCTKWGGVKFLGIVVDLTSPRHPRRFGQLTAIIRSDAGG
jgi:hypothetical protein